jgi:hypothetical protein
MFLFVVLILQNAIRIILFLEWIWVKYNFIAVNYLVYTNEVIEISWVLSSSSFQDFYNCGYRYLFCTKGSRSYIDSIPTFVEKIKISDYILFCLDCLWLFLLATKENSQNIFSNELQSNGVYKFYLAFMNSELDYFKFYKVLPERSLCLIKSATPGLSGESTLREIKVLLPKIIKCRFNYYRKLQCRLYESLW